MPSQLLRIRTVPGLIRALTAVAVLGLAGLFASTAMSGSRAQDGLRSIGDDDGPTVVATSNLYLALSDMDAQVTSVLLTGREGGWLCDPERVKIDRNGRERIRPPGCGRELPREYYEIRREDAQRAALEAAELAKAAEAKEDEGDKGGKGGKGGKIAEPAKTDKAVGPAKDKEVRLQTIQAILDGLHQYDRRVQAAMELGQRAGHPFGSPPKDAVSEYRAATSLMTEELLPQAYNLTLDSAALVNGTYREKRSAALFWQVGVIASGVIAVAVMVVLQGYFAVRFRRRVNPFLAVATLCAVALTMAGVGLLSQQADHLRSAKTDGFDSILTLSRAQAISKGLDADRGRYLLDPESADRHDQTYLDKSQTILYIPDTADLESYYAELDKRLARYDGDPRTVKFGGFYGQEAGENTLPGRREFLGQLLSRYRQYQRNDHHVRRLADSGEREKAARAHVHPGLHPDLSYLPNPHFREHNEALADLISRHEYVMDRDAKLGQKHEITNLLLPGASVLVIGAFVVAGVWQRLAEFR